VHTAETTALKLKTELSTTR